MQGQETTKGDLLVASAGGHLTQLHLLAGRLDAARPRTWVSYDHPHARGLLAGQELLVGHGPSTRSIRALARNWLLAGRLLSSGRFDRVISTGSGIAVPFLLRAERFGIDAHYVESATRTQGPSLSGRMLERLSREVRLHTQYADWAGGRWGLVSSVFDGFAVAATDQRSPADPLRVVVSLGTHRYPFPRLVDAVLAAMDPQDQVLLQHGSTSVAGHELAGVDARATVPGDEFSDALARADVVVAHAGTGIVLSALQAGHRPVVVPRLAAHGEHVDDHQLLTAHGLSETDLVVATSPEELTRDMLVHAAAWRVVRAAAAPIHLSA